jgi:hypothetical protein
MFNDLSSISIFIVTDLIKYNLHKVKLHFFKKHSELIKFDYPPIDFLYKLKRDNISYMIDDKWITHSTELWHFKEYCFYIDKKYSSWLIANAL